jgi:hypothetical protein
VTKRGGRSRGTTRRALCAGEPKDGRMWNQSRFERDPRRPRPTTQREHYLISTDTTPSSCSLRRCSPSSGSANGQLPRLRRPARHDLHCPHARVGLWRAHCAAPPARGGRGKGGHRSGRAAAHGRRGGKGAGGLHEGVVLPRCAELEQGEWAAAVAMVAAAVGAAAAVGQGAKGGGHPTCTQERNDRARTARPSGVGMVERRVCRQYICPADVRARRDDVEGDGR